MLICGDRLLCRMLPARGAELPSGIQIVTAQAERQTIEGEVVQIGPGGVDQHGNWVGPDAARCAVGDRVLLPMYTLPANPIPVDPLYVGGYSSERKEEYKIYRFSDVIAVYRDIEVPG